MDPFTMVIELEGELDLYAAAEMNASLVRAIGEQCRRLIVDLRAVSSIDFSTIAILAQSGRVLGNRRGSLEVLCRGGEMGKLLETAGESGRFDVRIVED